jgi:hypothetical protein
LTSINGGNPYPPFLERNCRKKELPREKVLSFTYTRCCLKLNYLAFVARIYMIY